jgi:hypothetical protein
VLAIHALIQSVSYGFIEGLKVQIPFWHFGVFSAHTDCRCYRWDSWVLVPAGRTFGLHWCRFL